MKQYGLYTKLKCSPTNVRKCDLFFEVTFKGGRVIQQYLTTSLSDNVGYKTAMQCQFCRSTHENPDAEHF